MYIYRQRYADLMTNHQEETSTEHSGHISKEQETDTSIAEMYILF